jgi:hypothetical protein
MNHRVTENTEKTEQKQEEVHELQGRNVTSIFCSVFFVFSVTLWFISCENTVASAVPAD